MWFYDGHLLTSASHQALFLPASEQATDRMQGRTGHFRNVLARKREIYQEAFVGPFAGLMDELEQGMGYPLIYLLR